MAHEIKVRQGFFGSSSALLMLTYLLECAIFNTKGLFWEAHDDIDVAESLAALYRFLTVEDSLPL